jgi:hypothetical protein
MDIKPTYLYIKQHLVTGLKYFGKTSLDLLDKISIVKEYTNGK